MLSEHTTNFVDGLESISLNLIYVQGPTTYKTLEHSWFHTPLWAWGLSSHEGKKNGFQRGNGFSKFKGDSAGQK